MPTTEREIPGVDNAGGISQCKKQRQGMRGQYAKAVRTTNATKNAQE
jgi:hypothetical protein